MFSSSACYYCAYAVFGGGILIIYIYGFQTEVANDGVDDYGQYRITIVKITSGVLASPAIFDRF
jgi:hypothetical protein